MGVPLLGVSPLIPSEEAKKRELGDDLLRMGCAGLLAQPWDLRDKEMLGELMLEHRNQW